MKRIVFLVIFMILITSSTVFSAGSCVGTVTNLQSYPSKYEAKIVCTSDASGDVSSPTYSANDQFFSIRHNGRIEQYTIIPTTGISSGYDVYLYKEKTTDTFDTTNDLLMAGGVGLSDTNTKEDTPLTDNGYPKFVYNKKLTVVASDMGDTKVFTLYLLFAK